MFRLDRIDWEPQQQEEGVTCVNAPQFFHMLGVILVHWLRNNPTEHVALILLYKAAVACFNHWKMQPGQDFQERLTVGTRESVQGDTFHRTIFLPVQKRSPDEWKPHGRSCHVGRRVVGLTRASHEPVMFCEWLWPSPHEGTEKIHNLFTNNQSVYDQQDCNRVLQTLHILQSPRIPPVNPIFHSGRGHSVSAVEFMCSPQQWLRPWRSVTWQPPRRIKT